MTLPGGRDRVDPRAAIQRDSDRLARRERDSRSFWRSLGVLGMVGWPIAVGSVGGSLLGRYLDLKLNTGIRFTLMCMVSGVILGSYAAWKTVDQRP